ncbi:MAG: hypothetical protein EBU40_15750, partial [Proteobacteria bacterium]|nr:hypothetical protein [Pseudomonadota bacterium]
RVAIARALAQQPRVLLADEPVASLDVELSWHVMSDLVRVARDEGVPTILSIHQVDLATAFADRIVGIAQGRVVFDGTPETLTEDALDRIYRFDVPAELISQCHGTLQLPGSDGVRGRILAPGTAPPWVDRRVGVASSYPSGAVRLAGWRREVPTG